MKCGNENIFFKLLATIWIAHNKTKIVAKKIAIPSTGNDSAKERANSFQYDKIAPPSENISEK